MDWVALTEGVPEIQVIDDEGVTGTPLTIVEVGVKGINTHI
jgi:hypothetical protein